MKKLEVFGKEIPANWRNELKLILATLNKIKETKTENITFGEVFSLAKQLRTNPDFNLKPFNELARKVQINFENRLAKTIGGSEISAYNNPSIQSKFFNFEIQTGQTFRFSSPIDPTENLSPQVKKVTFSFNFEPTGIIKPERKFEKLTKNQLKTLERFKNK